jgi:uncharacterized protein YggU (UPF0235/DUF167 family)
MLIKVRAFPNSKEENLDQTAGDAFEVKVREKPVRGLANARIRQLLAAHFGIMENKVRLVSGFARPNKIFEIKDISNVKS